jgi:hypothetical protein
MSGAHRGQRAITAVSLQIYIEMIVTSSPATVGGAFRAPVQRNSAGAAQTGSTYHSAFCGLRSRWVV